MFHLKYNLIMKLVLIIKMVQNSKWIHHTEIDLYTSKSYSKRLNNSKRLLMDQYSEYLVFDDTSGIKLIFGEQILWRQGWFFNKRFFNNKNTCYYATTRSKMIKILNMFIDPKSNDNRGVEAYSACLNAMKDGYIFELAW